jgi:Ca2+-transporting ATPase
MVFLGMVTLKNPIKCDWLSKLIKLKLAGVRTILMTYDHPATALSLANKANLVNSFNESSINLVTGEDLENLYSMGENVPEDHCDK